MVKVNFTIENIEIIAKEDYTFINETILINPVGDTAIIIDIDHVMVIKANK